jgi:hypothetical protein
LRHHDEAFKRRNPRVVFGSCSGSHLALEHFEGDETSLMTNPMTCSLQRIGVDVDELWYDDDRRAEPRISLLEDGWIVRVDTTTDEATAAPRCPATARHAGSRIGMVPSRHARNH